MNIPDRIDTDGKMGSVFRIYRADGTLLHERVMRDARTEADFLDFMNAGREDWKVAERVKAPYVTSYDRTTGRLTAVRRMEWD